MTRLMPANYQETLIINQFGQASIEKAFIHTNYKFIFVKDEFGVFRLKNSIYGAKDEYEIIEEEENSDNREEKSGKFWKIPDNREEKSGKFWKIPDNREGNPDQYKENPDHREEAVKNLTIIEI